VKIMPEKKERIRIPEDIEAQILFLNEHRCCMCNKGPKDGARIQTHHINEDPSDNRLENLAVLCRDCHDELKDRLWMGKSFVQGEIKKYKALWETAVSEKRKHLAFPPVIVKEKVTEKVDEKGRIERHIEREISYRNGLAPQAFGVSPSVPLSQEKKLILENAKRITTSQPSIEKLLQIFNEIKRTAEIRVDDMVILSRICLSLGDSKFHAGDYSMAEIFYKEALDYGKSAKESEIVGICLYELGAAVGMQGRHKEALAYFNEVIKMNKKDQTAWFNKGVALSFLNKRKEARSAYSKAIEFGTKISDWDTVASAHYNMGVSLARLGRYQEAVDSYLKAIEFGTKSGKLDTVASAHYNMGVPLVRLGRDQEAVDSYLKAIELRKFLSDRGERIFPSITLLICILGVKSIQNKNQNQAKELAKRLFQVYLNGRKDGMAKLIAKTMETFESKLSKENIDMFQEFKKLFEKMG